MVYDIGLQRHRDLKFRICCKDSILLLCSSNLLNINQYGCFNLYLYLYFWFDGRINNSLVILLENIREINIFREGTVLEVTTDPPFIKGQCLIHNYILATFYLIKNANYVILFNSHNSYIVFLQQKCAITHNLKDSAFEIINMDIYVILVIQS